MVIVGRIGTAELAASGIAFNLNMIVFMPMVGLAVAVSSLVGRYLGAGRPETAERVVGSALAMSFAYMTACGVLYVLGAPLLLAPYGMEADPATWPRIAVIATVLLRFVAVYSIFDMMNLIHAAGLRGRVTPCTRWCSRSCSRGSPCSARPGSGASPSAPGSTSHGLWRAGTWRCWGC